MPARPVTDVLRHLRAGPPERTAGPASDRELLDGFVAGREEAAFERLVTRHGPMVLAVCRRVLGDAHAAEDAFQATFLVLARKAGRIRRGELLANWLYGVARRTAARARVEAARRRARESAAPLPKPPPDPLDRVSARDLLNLLDEEISRLPARYRGPLIACHLEGKPRDEAAREFGWSLATLARRLERGRKLLGARLTRRGIGLALVAPLAVMSRTGALGGVPAPLVSSTVRAAGVVAAGGDAASVVPAGAAALTEGVLKAMSRTKLKAVVIAIAVAAAIGVGLGLIPPPERTLAAPAPKAEKQAHPLAGTWAVVRIDSRWPDRKEDPRTFAGNGDTWTFVFEKGACKMIEHTSGDDGKVRKVAEGAVTLDDASAPPRLTLHSTRDHLKGRIIYEVKGDTLRLCFYCLAEEGGKEVVAWPKGFDLDQEDVKKFPRLDVFKRVDLGAAPVEPPVGNRAPGPPAGVGKP